MLSVEMCTRNRVPSNDRVVLVRFFLNTEKEARRIREFQDSDRYSVPPRGWDVVS